MRKLSVITDSYQFSTILDPRFKSFGVHSEAKFNRAASQIKEELRKMIVASTSAVEAESLSSSSEHETIDQPKKSRFSFLKEHRKKQLSTTSKKPKIPHSSQAIVLFQAYLDDDLLPDEADVIKYWYNYAGCSALKEIALKHLRIPASSVSSERVNSTAGNIISEKRSRLKPELAEKLVFLRQNYQYLEL